MHTFWRTFYKFSQPHSPISQCLGHVLPDCSRRTQLKNASCFHPFKNGKKHVCVYFVYFLPGTNRPKGVKGTQAGVHLKRLLSGPAFPMESSIYLKPDPFLFPALSLCWVPNHCSVSLLKVEHTVAGAKSCGCVCLRLRLLSDLRQLAEEILFQNSEPWEKGCQQFFPPTCEINQDTWNPNMVSLFINIISSLPVTLLIPPLPFFFPSSLNIKCLAEPAGVLSVLSFTPGHRALVPSKRCSFQMKLKLLSHL